MWPLGKRHPDRTQSAATRARVKAERDLAAVRAETPRYRELGESLRKLRQHNNFAAAIETSFQGRQS